MNSKLTIKQENFCNYFVETGNASEAYRRAYDCSTMKPETVNRAATALMNNYTITTRVKELQEELKRKSDITKEQVVELCVGVIRGADVTDVRRNTGGTISAQTISKTWAIERVCKMLGFDAPTQSEVTGKVSVEQNKTEEEKKADFLRMQKSMYPSFCEVMFMGGMCALCENKDELCKVATNHLLCGEMPDFLAKALGCGTDNCYHSRRRNKTF